ncbi:MAG TPA: CrcB family protein [Pseudolysinimonas sp.]|jgi:CrcB protein
MTLLAVVVGGLLGTGLRLTLDTLLPHSDSAFPWSTLIINLVGAFVLGILVARVWPTAPAWLKAGLGPGLIGTFTTFSALVVSLLTLTRAGMPLTALLYLLVSVVGGLLAAALGLRLGRTSARTPRIEADE